MMELPPHRKTLSNTWIDRIHDHLYISGVIFPEDYPTLRAIGIGAIVNLIPDYDYAASLDPSIWYLHEPIEDGQPIPLPALDRIYQVIHQHIHERKVLVHCGMGVSRSGGVVVGQILYEHPEWSWQKAFQYVYTIHQIDPAPEIAQSIMDYIEAQLREKKGKK